MPTDLSDADLQLRRTLSFRLRTERRMTFQAIAAALAQGTVNPATGETVAFTVTAWTVRTDYYRTLRDQGHVLDPKEVEVQRAAELRDLDELQAAYWNPAVGRAVNADGSTSKVTPDAKAASVVLRCIRERANLAGLTQVRVSGHDGGPLQVQLSLPDDAIVGMLQRAIERGVTTPQPASMN